MTISNVCDKLSGVQMFEGTSGPTGGKWCKMESKRELCQQGTYGERVAARIADGEGLTRVASGGSKNEKMRN